MKKNKKVNSVGIIDIVLNNKSIIIFAILVAILAFIEPTFFSAKNLMNVMRQGSISVIMGLGFTLVMASGNLDLSVGYMLGFIGVVTAAASKVMPVVPAVLIGLALGAFCGWLNGLIGTKLGVPMFISTLAMGSVFQGANYLFTNNKAVAQLPTDFTVLGQGYVGKVPIPIIVMLLVAVVLWIIVNRTRFGRYCLAIGGNREAAKVSGINVNGITRRVYIIMGLCAAIAAIVLTGRAASAQNTAGVGMEMDAIAAVVIGGTPLTGGKGNIIGTLFGCLIITTIGNGMNLMGINSNWQIVAKGLLILIAVVIDLQSSRFINKRLQKNALNG